MHVLACRIVNVHTDGVRVVPRVSERVGQNRRQLQSVTERIQLAQARVDKIKGSKKATKVPPPPVIYSLYGSRSPQKQTNLVE